VRLKKGIPLCLLGHVAIEDFFVHRTHVVDFLEDRWHFGIQYLLNPRFEKIVAFARYLNVVTTEKFLH
jgi:hypothetical protein